MNKQTKVESDSPYFSFVIPAYNEEDHIGLCLQSIFNSEYDSTQYEVIVVDNGSQDRSHKIASDFPHVRVFELRQGNVGAVRNYGAEKARGRMLIFIDADCLIDINWLRRVEKFVENCPNCAYGGGAKLSDNATWIERSWLLQNKNLPTTLPKHLIGASTLLPKKLFFKTNGFNELVSSGEDTDLHFRLASQNVPVLIDNAFDVTHLGNAKTSIQFIKRQIWHSENYAIDLMRSLKDPIFLITLTFLILPFLAGAQFLLLPNKTLIIITLAIWGCVPALLSFKRILRAHFFRLNLRKLLQIYFLDFLYLSGRSLGLLKGLLNSVK